MSFFSDNSSDEDAVDNLLNQAMDHSILDQIAKINCSSFSNDHVLPIHLENRLSKLKSFPLTKNQQHPTSTNFNFGEKTEKINIDPVEKIEFEKNPVGETDHKMNLGSGSEEFCSKSRKGMEKIRFHEKDKKLGSGSGSSLSDSSDFEFEENPVGKTDRRMNLGSGSDYFCSKSSKKLEKSKFSEKGKKLGSGYVSSPENTSDSSTGSARGRKAVKSKSRSGSFLSRSDSSDFSPSPEKKSGCLWFSPKRASAKKSKGGKGIRCSEDFLSGLAKKEQKLLEKALREEDKINREAEKIVKLVKLGSARMNNF